MSAPQRWVVLVLVLLLAAGCTTGDGAPEPSPSPTVAVEPSPTSIRGLQVAVVLPPATLRSQAQLDALRDEVEAFRDARRDGVASVRIVQPDAPAFTQDLVALLAEGGAGLVCVLGPDAGAAVTAVAPSFPRTRFCATPAIAEPEAIPSNVLLIDLRVEELAYLAGVAAQLSSGQGAPGFVAGETQYATDRQRLAFGAGINAVADEPVVPYVGFPVSDADRAFELARPQYAAGVATIYTVAGDADAGVRRAAQREGGLVIGSLLTLVPDPDEPPPVAVLMTTHQRLDLGLGIAVDQALDTWSGGLASVGLAEGALGVSEGGSARYRGIAATLDDVRGRIERRELVPLSSD